MERTYLNGALTHVDQQSNVELGKRMRALEAEVKAIDRSQLIGHYILTIVCGVIISVAMVMGVVKIAHASDSEMLRCKDKLIDVGTTISEVIESCGDPISQDRGGPIDSTKILHYKMNNTEYLIKFIDDKVYIINRIGDDDTI